MEVAPKKGIRSRIKNFLTGGRRNRTKVELFSFYVFYILMMGDILLSFYMVQYAYTAAEVAFPSKGFGVVLPLVFAENGTTYPLIYVAVSANTTTVSGLAFLADAPITVHVNATIETHFVGNESLSFFVHDGEPYTGYGTVVFPQPTPINLKQSQNGAYWTGKETIYFVESGNYAPEMMLTVDGQSVPLHQISDFKLQVQPVNDIISFTSNQVNLILAVSLYFFALVDSFILMRGIYPKAFPKRAKEVKTDAKANDKEGEIGKSDSIVVSSEEEPQKGV